MATKTAVNNENAPDFTSMFNWGLKITGFEELFLLAGHGDHGPDGQIRNPGDPVAQTRNILADVRSLIETSGYERNDIIRIEFTLTKDVTEEQFGQILGIFVAFFEPVGVKPAAGTLRFVDALAFPGLMVEYEIWCAR